MLIIIPLLAPVLMISMIIYQKRSDMRNQCLLLFMLVLSIAYLAIWKPFTPATQVFILTAATVIIPVITLVVIIINYFSGGQTTNTGNYRMEIKRKLFHLVGFLVFIPPAVVWMSYISAIYGFTSLSGITTSKYNQGYYSFVIFLITYSLLILFVTIEYIRLTYKPDLFTQLLREKESDRIASYIYTATSIYIISLLFFPYDNIVCAAIAMGLLSDLAACIVGKKLRKIAYKDRSLEGFLANFITGSIVGYFFVGIIAILVALAIATVDFLNGALELRINDNLLFPLLAATLLWFLLVY